MSGVSNHSTPANDTTNWVAHASAILAQRRTRKSSARTAIVASLATQDCCASAQEIHTRLRNNGSPIGIASVYRTLELLHHCGLVTRVDTGDGSARFEPANPNGEHHHHLICNECGSVEAFHDDALEAAIHAVSNRVVFRITAHEVALRGACQNCR